MTPNTIPKTASTDKWTAPGVALEPEVGAVVVASAVDCVVRISEVVVVVPR